MKLLPCPFCGESPEYIDWSQDGHDIYSVECENDECVIGACGTTKKYGEKEEAAEAWNTRTHTAPAISYQGPWCCEKARAQGVPICDECRSRWGSIEPTSAPAPGVAPRVEAFGFVDPISHLFYHSRNLSNDSWVRRDCTPVYTAPPAPVAAAETVEGVAFLRGLGQFLLADAEANNHCTAHPMFVVQKHRRVYGFDPEYSDKIVWLDAGNDYREASEKEAKTLNKMDERGKETGDWVRTAYKDEWETFTTCVTRPAADEIARSMSRKADGGDYRVYVDSAYRNREWRDLQAALMALAAASPEKEKGDGRSRMVDK